MQAMHNRHPLNGNTYPSLPLLKRAAEANWVEGGKQKARLTAYCEANRFSHHFAWESLVRSHKVGWTMTTFCN